MSKQKDDDRDFGSTDCSSATWGFTNASPQEWDWDKAKRVLRDFESSLATREYPDEYVCTQEAWDAVKELVKRTHSQGIGRSELVRIAGVPVVIRETISACVDYIAASKMVGRRVQLIS